MVDWNTFKTITPIPKISRLINPVLAKLQLIDQTIAFGQNNIFWSKQSLLAKIIFDFIMHYSMLIRWLCGMVFFNKQVAAHISHILTASYLHIRSSCTERNEFSETFQFLKLTLSKFSLLKSQFSVLSDWNRWFWPKQLFWPNNWLKLFAKIKSKGYLVNH